MSMEEEKTEPRTRSHKLYKSSSDRIIDGVCGGLAEYLGIEATVVRLLLVAFSILSVGGGVIFYIIGMVVIPTRPLGPEAGDEAGKGAGRSAGGATVTLVLGIIIVIIGLTLLFDYYDILPITFAFTQFGKLALPIIFILIGGALLLGRAKSGPGEREDSQTGGTAAAGAEEGEFIDEGMEKKRLTRSVRDKKIAGVCGGLAAYLDVDSTIVRLAYVILAFASFGLALILYVACAFIIPKEVR